MNNLEKKIRQGIEAQSFARLLGITLEHAEEGSVTVSCARRADLLQQTGLLHGGVVAALAEAAGGYAALTMLPEGMSTVGVEYKVNFLRPNTGKAIRAVSKVVKRGRTLFVVDVEVFDADSGKMTAKMLLTCMPVKEG